MTAQRVRTRICSLAAVSLAATLAACTIEEGTPNKATDTAAGAVVDSTPAAGPAPVRGTFGPDNPTSIREMAPAQIQQALRTDTAHTLDVIDSTPAAVPTDVDLATLKREMMVPVSGVPASALYDSYTELRGGTRPHEALDIPAPRGTPVLSAANGRVLKLFNSKAGGLMVYAADSTERFILMYAHLDAYQPGLADGQPLRRGQQIGVVGTTGNAPPNVPHLHFAIARSTDVKQWWKGSPVNPYPLLR
jgi:septal ring factor EnvC (AmiA/AmiB activator)